MEHYTRKAAIEVLASKGIKPHNLELELQTEPLKTVAKRYRIGHVRLSACVKALDLRVPSKKEKISRTNIASGLVQYRQREAALDTDKVASQIPHHTLKVLKNKLKVRESWLLDLAKERNLHFQTLTESRLIAGSERVQKADKEFTVQHGEMILRMVEENATRLEMVRALGGSSNALDRFLATKAPQWREQANLSKRASRASSKGYDPTRTKILQSNAITRSRLKITDEDLRSLVLDRLYGSCELTKVLGVGEAYCRMIVLARTKVDLKDHAVLRARGRKSIESGETFTLDSYPALKMLKETFQINIPLAFSRQPALFLSHVALKNPEYLSWIIDHVKAVTHQDLCDHLAFGNGGSVGCVIGEHNLGSKFHPPLDKLAILASNLRIDVTSQAGQQTISELLDSKAVNTLAELCEYLEIDVNTGRRLQARGWIPRKWANTSSFELQIKKELERLSIDFEWQKTGLLPNARQELDFWIPSKRIAIEVNPTYTHNSTYGWSYSKELAKSKTYHSSKVMAARENGIQLLMLYERDLTEPTWSNITAPFLKFKLSGAEKIFYGRDVKVSLVGGSERKEIREFINTHHSQGAGRADSYYVFKSLAGVTLGAASFSKNPALGPSNSTVELKRLVFAPGVQIRYGLSKLIKQLKRDFPELESLYSYSRNDMGEGDAYARAGFDLVRDTGPGLTYVNPSNPNDHYSWSIGSPWGVKSGVLSRHFTEEDFVRYTARELITEKLPHRNDTQLGYVEVYNAGSRLWELSL